MINIKINNKPVEAKEGSTILAAAAKAGVTIPTLCDNEELTAVGACRICAVEIRSADFPGHIVTACTQPVSEGMEIFTDSEPALKARRLAVELLLARKPHSQTLERIASDLGIQESRFTLPEQECILCQLCSRTCHEVVGVNAITFVTQGLSREETEPNMQWSKDRCIACGSCAYVCPTRAVTLTDESGVRTLNTPDTVMEFKLKACTKCGTFYAPEKQLEYMARQSNQPLDKFDICLDCRD